MTQRARYGWMALGGLICLFGIVATVKWRDSSRALAQTTPLPPPPAATDEVKPPPVGAEVLKAPLPEAPKAKLEVSPPPVGPPPVSAPQPPLGSEPRPIQIPAPAKTPPPVVEQLIPKVPETPPSDPLIPIKAETPKDHPGEPPLAPAPGPVVTYRLTRSGETFRTLAKKTLSNSDRWSEIHKLNPNIKADAVLVAGTVVRLPADACVVDEEAVRPLPSLRSRPAPKVKSVYPLTGTFLLALDDKMGMTLPKAILTQLGNCDTVLLSPGSDRCLWLTNQAHLDRLAAKLDKSPARESAVRNFKRLYYAQTVKIPVKDGRIVITDKLSQFAGLHQELVLVGIDDHFEVWDAASWRRYTQAKKATVTDY